MLTVIVVESKLNMFVTSLESFEGRTCLILFVRILVSLIEVRFFESQNRIEIVSRNCFLF